ncbi:hypothetical protein VNO77_03964 [Canavalia gladiata]|uniref:Uncharacterized protein n=1 Tax=Canavalia gladiata TaxID=3824 RepID=A0AAN9MVM6_CANGL
MEKRPSSTNTLKMKALSVLSMPHSFLKSNDLAMVSVELDLDFDAKCQIHNENEENVDEKEDFSFACIEPQGTLVSADEIFDNGKIKPTYPIIKRSFIFTTANGNDTLTLQPPLKKVFVKQVNNFTLESKGVNNVNEKLENTMMVEMKASNEKCKKSNSTGFSRIWRFRQNTKLRSNSDGKDAFVFLNPSVPIRSNQAKEENVVSNKEKDKKCKKSMSAHEKHYVTNRKRKESVKRKSFLPYKKDLIGFFANVNGFSRNLHPF